MSALLGVRPIRVEQQPGQRRYPPEVLDLRVQQLPRPGRIRDHGYVEALDGEQGLAGKDVAGIDAAQPERFEVPDEVTDATAGLDEARGCRARADVE